MITHLVDTDVMIDFFRGVLPAVDLISRSSDSIALSVITEAELYAGVREGKERHSIETFLNLVTIIPVNRAIAQKAGLYQSDFARATKIGMADSIIAATAETEKLQLLTLKIKHFPMLHDIQSPYQKS